MTSDMYVFLVAIGSLGLVGVSIGWAYETWPRLVSWWADQKQASKDLRAVQHEPRINTVRRDPSPKARP